MTIKKLPEVGCLIRNWAGMMTWMLAGCVGLLLITASSRAATSTLAQPEVVIAEFSEPDSLAPWTFYNGAEYPGATGSLTLAEGHSGIGARLAYDLSQGGNYTAAQYALPTPLTAAAISFWVKSPSNVIVTLQVVDSTNQVLQYRLPRPVAATDVDAWYQQIVALDGPSDWYFGANDGILHNPIKAINLAANRVDLHPVGAIYFDDIRAFTASGKAPNPWVDLTTDNLGQLSVNETTGRMLIKNEKYNTTSFYRSDDGGVVWQHTGPEIIGVRAPFASPSGTDFIQTDNGLYRLGKDDSVWQKVIAEGSITFMAESPDGTVMACLQTVWVDAQLQTYHTVLQRSVDGGLNWTQLAVVSTSGTGSVIRGMAVADANTYLVSDEGLSAVLRTTDGGATFTAVSIPRVGGSYVRDLLVDRLVPNRIYLGSAALDVGDGVYKSDDGGATWGPYNAGLPVGSSASSLTQTADGTLYITTGAVYRRQPADEAWQAIDMESAVRKNGCQGVRVGPNGAVYGMFGYFGIQKLDSATEQWSTIKTPFVSGNPPAVGTLWVDATDRVYCSLGDPNADLPGPSSPVGTLYTSDDGGLTWDVQDTDGSITGRAATDTDGNMYCTTGNRSVLKSVDGGEHWETASSFRFPSIPTGMVAVGDRLITGTRSNGVYFSDDGAITWHEATGLPANQTIGQLCAIGDGGLVGLHRDLVRGYGIYRTTGSTDMWILDNGGIPESDMPKIRGIGSGGNGVAYAWGLNGIFSPKGGGVLYRKASPMDNWVPQDLPGGFNVVSSIASPVGGTLVTTYGGGVYHRMEGPGSWWVKIGDTRLDDPYGNPFTAIAIDGKGRVYAGTNNFVPRGVYSCLVPELVPTPLRPASFDAAGYLAHNPDVAAVIGESGDKLDQAWLHYYNTGLAEGRTDGDFDVATYLARYPNLAAIYGTDLKAAALHWYTAGRAAGERIPDGFSVAGYFARNADIAALFVHDKYGAWLHYYNYGLFEGRSFDANFIPAEYLELNTDLKGAFGSDWQQAVMHWLAWGHPVEDRMGRVPIGFNVDNYLARYPDLSAAFGGITPTAVRNVTVWNHYVYYGTLEGRSDGDFEGYDYLATNADLAAVFGSDVRAAAHHWYFYGRREGRRIPSAFDVQNYRALYPDIVVVYGDDLYGSWLHFRDQGVYEGRIYDNLFRPDDYLALNPDVAAVIGTDRKAALLHWLFYGKAELRPGKF